MFDLIYLFDLESQKMLFDILFVICPPIGFMAQYQEIYKSRNMGGFSTKVILILVLSNILRIFFWFGKRFSVVLIYQSLFMILAQLFLLQLCVKVKKENKFSQLHRIKIRKKNFGKKN